MSSARDIRREEYSLQRQSTALLWAIRSIFLLLWIAVTFIAIFKFAGESESSTNDATAFRIASQWWWPTLVSAALCMSVILIDIATPNKKLQTVSGVFMGLMAGILAAVAIGFIVDLITQLANFESKTVIGAIQILIGVACSYLGITIVLQTQDDFRLVIPYVEFAKQIRGARPLTLDTSTVIDGRFLGLAETGVTQAPILIPTFVLGELQALADSADKGKRQRGRRGLDIISKLQRSPRLDVTIDDAIVPGKNVDQMIVEYALQTNATIVTTDAALERIAGIKGVQVLNMNDVANSVKTQAAPGEEFDIRIIRQGEQAGQGVGYLDDGTMIVAVDGGGRIGEVVTITVTNSLQTSAGRLIFGRISDEDDAHNHAEEPHPREEQAEPESQPQTGPLGPGAARNGGRGGRSSTPGATSPRNPRR
ncbi:MAG: PIN/TRAM domain-containing protein [Phycisphaeraceae bacterium]|nr:PIN/TRAM domain-containing protein [Phycisphaeraceae bacterium]